MRVEKEKLGVYAEEFTIENKAKVAIIGVRKADRKRALRHGTLPMPSVYLPTRSRLEDTRWGGDDWFGGTLELGEMPIDGLIRDTGEEAHGLTLDLITELDVVERKRNGTQIFSHLFAAIAYGEGELSEEHDGGEWVPLNKIPDRKRLSRTPNFGHFRLQTHSC